MRVLNLLPAVALLPSALGQLHKLTKAKGKYFGSATDNYELKDAPYFAILTDVDEFGQITPSNAQKWAYSEPTPGNFSFAGGDEVADLAEATGQMLRCHALVWHSQVADYINAGPWTNETLIAAMKDHIKGMVTHFKGRCAHWDVVNEAFEEDGSYRKTPFYNIIGPEYIPIAFETAAKYDPDVKLYYNDYNLEYNGAKTAAARDMVAAVKARGIKIDGVGLQGHLIVGKTPGLTALTAMVKSFADLGVEVAYTEIDIRYEALPPTTAGLAQQDTDYVNTVLSCINVPGCVGLTIWDFTDKYSWIPGVFKGQGDALLWDLNLKKKQVYYAVIKALGGTVPSSTSSSVPSTTSSMVPSTTSSTAPSTTTSAASSTTTTTTASPSPIKCSSNNCLRNLVDSRFSSMASEFCATYTQTVNPEPTAIPSYLGNCQLSPSRVSSACTCLHTTSKTTTSTSTTAPSCGGLPKYSQCGGLSWKGASNCVAGTKCLYQNKWHSQCL